MPNGVRKYRKMMGIRICCFVLSLLAVACSAGVAAAATDELRAGDSFSRGLQAYESGNSAEAEPLFVRAIAHEPRDPRPHYFRALCLLHQGKIAEARSDIVIGAALEARSRGGYPVGKSLEHIQGGDRLLLEQYRWPSPGDGAAIPGKTAKSHADEPAAFGIQTDAGALRQKVSVPLDRLVQPVSLAELVSVSAASVPASTEPKVPLKPIEEHSTDSGAPVSSDPFADDAKPATVDTQPAPEGRIPSGKLLGIFGRAIMHAAPVPSVDRLRQQIPGLPTPSANSATPASGAASRPDASVAPADDDPFSAPAQDNTETKKVDQPADAAEEDPFG